MASSIHYKYRAWKEPQRITFDGTGLNVFELKREIIAASGLGDGKDFDFLLYNQDNEEYTDDTEIVPRSSLVICRRLPAARPGYGKAARYVSGQAPTTAKNSYRTEQSTKATDGKGVSAASAADEMNKAQTEEEKVAAMFKAEAWEQTQQQMANAKPVHRPGGFNKKPVSVPEHAPPPGYVCNRCGIKGHWIQACPTNDDPNFDKRRNIKRTTGIPKTFLQKVEKPKDIENDGLTDDRKQGSVMMNADGDYVIVKTDDRTWEKFQEKNKTSIAQKAQANEEQKELEKRGLVCPIDSRLFVNPVKTDCCGATYCNDCIENALINSDLTCPKCGTEGVLIDNLQTDEEMVKKIHDYEAEKAAEKRAKERSQSPKSDTSKTVDHETPKQNGEQSTTNGDKTETDGVKSKEGSKSPSAQPKSQTGTPKPAAATPSDSSNSKKRPAEEELQNDRVPSAPSAPAAMRRQQEMQQKQAVQNIPPGFDKNFIDQMNALAPPTNFQNMPFMPNMNGMPFPNMAMAGMMGMPNAGMMNPMNMGNQNMGGQNMGGQNMFGMNQFGGFNGMGGNGGGYGQNWNNQWNGMQNWQGGNQGFPNQQRNAASGFDGQTEDTDAYFRKPVNPHRHTNRNRRARPTDYTEL